MSDIRAVVNQNTYPTAAEGALIAARANRRGELIVPDWMTQLAIDGNVYNFSNQVQEGGAKSLIGETAPGTNNVNPSLLVDVPTGTTIIPLEVLIMPEGTGASGDWTTIKIHTDDKIRLVSGGNKVTPINMAKDDPNTSNCSAYDGSTQIVASANEDDDTIWFSSYDFSVRNNELVYWSAKEFTPPILIGPAALLVFPDVSNIDEEILFSIKWAEFSTNEIIEPRT